MKKMILLCMIVILLIGVSGCMKSRENIESRALKYMEEKYDETFTVIDSVPSGMDVPYDEIVMYSKSYPDKKITVRRKKDGAKYYFTDNYFGILKEDEYLNLTKTIVDEFFADSKIYFNYTVDFFDNNYVQSTDLLIVMQENKRAIGTQIRIFVLDSNLSMEEYEATCEDLFAKLQEENYKSLVTVSLMEQEMYDEVNSETYLTILTDIFSDETVVTGVVK